MATTRKRRAPLGRKRPGRPIGSGRGRPRPLTADRHGTAPLKKQLAREISRIITSRDLTQTEAGAIAGEAPSQISLLMSGHLQGFSVERLLRTLVRLGQNVEVALSPTPGLRAGKLALVAGKRRGR